MNINNKKKYGKKVTHAKIAQMLYSTYRCVCWMWMPTLDQILKKLVVLIPTTNHFTQRNASSISNAIYQTMRTNQCLILSLSNLSLSFTHKWIPNKIFKLWYKGSVNDSTHIPKLLWLTFLLFHFLTFCLS